KRNLDGSIRAGWIDFGAADLQESKEQSYVNSELMYGSIIYTAPELMKKNIVLKNLKKLDIFALGFALFKLHFGRIPTWTAVLGEYHKKHRDFKNLPTYFRRDNFGFPTY